MSNLLNNIKNLVIGWFLIWLIVSPVPTKISDDSPIFFAGGQLQYEVTNSVDNLDKKKYFREMLVKHFPDFESRASMEKRQAIIYQKAVKKIKEHQKISPLLQNHQKWLTAEEKSSIDYFHGAGIYAKFQDPKTSPNIHDTRKTFLKKMENQEMREKFLETYNQKYSIK